MNLYYDSEFTGLHQHTSLISIAFIDDAGRAFYAEFNDYQASQCDAWIGDNVLKHTRWLNTPSQQAGHWQENKHTLCYGDSGQVKTALEQWLAHYAKISVWADCPAWDWVLLCELFGGARGLPASVFYLPHDLATLFHAKGLHADTDRKAFAGLQETGHLQRHNALFDAELVRACYWKLQDRGDS